MAKRKPFAPFEKLPIAELVKANLADLLKRENALIRSLLATYREELDGMLIELELVPETTFQAHRLKQIIAQLEGGIKAMELKLQGKLKAEAREVQQLSLFHSKEEILEGERRSALKRISRTELDATFAPLIDNDALIAVRETVPLSTRAWSEGQITQIRGTLTSGVLQQKTPKQVADDLRRVLGPKVEGYKIERIARTEFWRAVNSAHLVSALETSSKHPQLGLRKNWVAILDGKCHSGVCPRLHALGPISVAVAFKDEATGATYAIPPAHPNCRCRIVISSPKWGGTDVAETAEGRREQRAARRSERQREREEAHRRFLEGR